MLKSIHVIIHHYLIVVIPLKMAQDLLEVSQKTRLRQNISADNPYKCRNKNMPYICTKSCTCINPYICTNNNRCVQMYKMYAILSVYKCTKHSQQRQSQQMWPLPFNDTFQHLH